MTPLLWVDLTFEWYKDDMVFRVFIVIFLFRTNGKIGDLNENDFLQGYGIFFESGILKVTWSQLSSKSLSTITRHIDNSILKDTLQFYILRTWINMCAKSFIKTSVNVTETIIDECAWKKTSYSKIPACTWKNIGPK